ncbi:hypothetical protein VB715_07905 [Crocosphaera sp. UHCC 0190]|uniref:hypothetical protein n=1 Tax=Crocosphaera sp. UHCC 0190 TaxID=3110246 RepID=UPI002B1EB0B0|nr:hypothetical protein [Crocosphaera sp. UHCC 0190]MEA5509686.1 hypothetical protein [Crocosphaera sp. UHCC 0190]
MKLKLIAWGIGITTVAATGFVGLVYLVNLPYPMIRRPVSKVAPLLLLPSYIEMDHNYREAIAHVEQADQLIHHVSSFDDITLGEKKVKIAQQNLDKLPVWFIGYEPKRYCQMFSCSWQFTLDEFEAARKQIGRMEAIIFQQKNAYNTYQQAAGNLQQAQKDYQTAINPQQKQTILTNWQHSLDELQQLPADTFAATLASNQLEMYQRDFQAVAGDMDGLKKGNTMIQAAQQFSLAATNLCKNPPHPVEKWQQCDKLWQQAIERLEKISPEETSYLATQTLLAQYQSNLGIIKIREKIEADSVDALETAKDEIQRRQTSYAKRIEPEEKGTFVSELQGTIDQLKEVQTGTSSYQESQGLLKLAQAKLQEVSK